MPEDTQQSPPENDQPPKNDQPPEQPQEQEATPETPPEAQPPKAPVQVGKLSAENKAKAHITKANVRVDEVDQSPDMPPVEPHLFMELVDPEIMGMDIRLVVQDLALVERGLAEFHRQFMALAKRKGEIEKKMEAIGKRSAGLGKVQLILEKTQKCGPGDAIKRFQKQSMQNRANKVKNAQQFIKAGTSPEAIKQMLNPKSPIDQGFAGRKPGIGQGRPGQRLPARI